MKRLNFNKLALTVAIVTLSGVSVFAQSRQYEYKVSRFSDVEVNDNFKLTVQTGNSCKAVVTAEEAYKDYISCSVKGSKLIVDLDERKVPSDVKKLYRGKDPLFRVTVTVPSALSSITLNDKAELDVLDVTSTEDFSIALDNNAQAKDLRVRAQNVTVTTEKKSDVNISVDCESFTLNSSGNSDVKVSYTCASNATLNIAGGSDVTANGTSSLIYINAKGNSKSVCSGNASKAEFNCGGSSNVDATNLDIQEAFVNMSSICNLKEAASQLLHVNLQGGSSLLFAGDPEVKIENIKSSSMSPLGATK